MSIQQYQHSTHQTEVPLATPYQLIGILLQGALDRLASVKGHIIRNNISQKGSTISNVISILEVLQASLITPENASNNEIVENLNNLYQYMIEQLLQANMNNDCEKIDEVIKLLGEIKAGWDGIENEVANSTSS